MVICLSRYIFAMEAMRQQVCDVIDVSTTVLGVERPAPEDLELAAVAVQR